MTSSLPFDQSPARDFRGLLQLEGRNFVVLGAGMGIGRQTAHALSQFGAKVVCVDIDGAHAGFVADEINGIPVQADITRRADVERAFAVAAARCGAVHGVIDIVGMPLRGPVLEMSEARWQQQMDVVLNHAFHAVQIGGRAIIKAGGGAMVFVGSLSGLGYLRGQAAYAIAKAGLHHLVECMGRELAPQNVRVNGVAPGFIRTPRLNAMRSDEEWQELSRIIPRGSPGESWEIAAPILFLCSGLSTYITGQVLNADGGAFGMINPARGQSS